MHFLISVVIIISYQLPIEVSLSKAFNPELFRLRSLVANALDSSGKWWREAVGSWPFLKDISAQPTYISIENENYSFHLCQKNWITDQV